MRRKAEAVNSFVLSDTTTLPNSEYTPAETNAITIGANANTYHNPPVRHRSQIENNRFAEPFPFVIRSTTNAATLGVQAAPAINNPIANVDTSVTLTIAPITSIAMRKNRYDMTKNDVSG